MPEDQVPNRELIQTVTRVNASHIGDGGFVSFVHDHHVDSRESSVKEKYDFYYDYDVYRFSDGSQTLAARSYSFEPTTVNLISFETGDDIESLTESSFALPLVQIAIGHLRALGKQHLRWLNVEGKGDAYIPIPEASADPARDA
jgi:hypothetical protein